jgi:hypothetical protein
MWRAAALDELERLGAHCLDGEFGPLSPAGPAAPNGLGAAQRYRVIGSRAGVRA